MDNVELTPLPPVHTPVLLEEVLSGLGLVRDGIYVDLTLGRAGHSQEILKRIPLGTLYGFDQDREAINASQTVLSTIGSNFTLIHANFINAAEELEAHGVVEVHGILLDLGVSSPQFDQPERGFSYRFDGPLDMRMDPENNRTTAAEIVNTYPLGDLANIFRDYGEEKFAYQIAKRIVKTRQKTPINTTFALVDIIKSSKPDKELRKPGHPAKQVFQALRIAVNDELNVLEKTLKKMLPLLTSGGRMAVISFHSLEDRIVKNVFRDVAIVEGNKRLPYQAPAAYQLVNRKVIVATDEEVLANPRAHSAKLRIIERK